MISNINEIIYMKFIILLFENELKKKKNFIKENKIININNNLSLLLFIIELVDLKIFLSNSFLQEKLLPFLAKSPGVLFSLSLKFLSAPKIINFLHNLKFSTLTA